jgi:hypothetical protein
MTNNKQALGKSLEKSLKAEEKSVDDRFIFAESVLSDSKIMAAKQVEAPGEESAARVVRDTFTMPKADYELIGAVRERLLQNGLHFSKSEVVRAGLTILSKMPDTELVLMMNMVERIKIGRRQK